MNSASKPLRLETREIRLETPGESSIHDITPALREGLRESGLREGQVLVFVPGSTGAITMIEFEPGLIADIPAALEKIAPRHGDYLHHETWHDDNGSSHVRAALIGPSETIPFVDGELILGTWQQVVLLDFDTRPRSRRLIFQLTGR